MAEEEVNYASVVFKSKKHSPPVVKKEEETVYDEVKVQSETTEQTTDANVSAGFLPDKKANNRRRHYKQLACCLGILCVFLLLAIIAFCVYLTTLSHESELNQFKDNQTTLQAVNHNLTNLNKNLSSENEILRRDHKNLTDHFDNLTRAYAVLGNKVTNLTDENQNLTRRNQELETRNQELETQRNNLTQQIQNMETNWNELNVSRAQWSIDAYCPKEDEERQCKACQKGWDASQTSCYAFNNPEPPGQRTWEGAREDCRGKNSDLAVIFNEAEKTFVNNKSFNTRGFWIGLRVENGRWKWLDGRELTANSWMQPATDGHCAVFVRDKGWKSVSCGEKQQWICQMNALSV